MNNFSPQLSVLPAYGLSGDELTLQTYGSGLIHHTWKVTSPGGSFILQQVNDTVFRQPEDIASNLRLIADYLRVHHPGYLFVSPLRASDGRDLTRVKGRGVFRLFPYVTGSRSSEVVESPRQAFEAARQFGRFTRLLSGLNVRHLKITLPNFHDLGLRYRQFQMAQRSGDVHRLKEARELIQLLAQYADIVKVYEAITRNPDFRMRVTHHDTKISNVLFDEQGRGLCVVDLDTVMPGYFLSDVGDMMRTYLSPVSEEESNTHLIEIRQDVYEAIVQGYSAEMKGELTSTEKGHFFYAGTFMIYMQALRFLTDYLNLDTYYGARYPGHNLVRAQNQAVLLQRLMEKKSKLEGYGAR